MKELQDLQQIVTETIKGMIAAGTVEKKLKENAEKMVNAAIDSVFDYKMKEKLAEAITAGLNFDPKELSLPEYHQIIQTAVGNRIKAIFDNEKFAKLDEFIGDILKLAPPEIKLSELAEQFKRQYEDDIDGEFTFLLSEDNYGYSDICFDVEKNKGKYDCRVRIGVNKESRVWTLNLDGRKGDEKIFVQPLYGFDLLVYQLYLNKSILVIDTTDIDTTMEENED